MKKRKKIEGNCKSVLRYCTMGAFYSFILRAKMKTRHIAEQSNHFAIFRATDRDTERLERKRQNIVPTRAKTRLPFVPAEYYLV